MTDGDASIARVQMESRGAAVDVEISVVSLLGGSHLQRCLAALPEACAGLSWRVTLVDNSPSGLDLDELGEPSSDFAVIRSRGRRGFGANHNLVLAGVVEERRARYALVLNDDTELNPGGVTRLVHCADQHARTGAVGPAIPESGMSMFAWPTPASQVVSSLVPRRLIRPTAQDGWLTGACVLLATEALAEIGLFDTQFFLFFEDADLCRRLVDAGWRTMHCAQATAVHHRAQTTTRTSTEFQVQQQMLRSQYLYARKHHGVLTARLLDLYGTCALWARTALFALRALTGRADLSTVKLVWALSLYRPPRPTQFEIEASETQPAAPQRLACRIGRS